MSSDSTRVQLRGPKELGNCCSSDYQDHEHQHILNHIALLQSVHHVNNDSEAWRIDAQLLFNFGIDIEGTLLGPDIFLFSMCTV